MIRLPAPLQRLATRLDDLAPAILPTLARLSFVGILLVYYWNSAGTKLGDGVFGVFSPSFGAYAQIFPETMEAISYDVSELGLFHWAVVVAGTVAEYVLPLLILLGLLTRLAALGMIGFVFVQSWVDIHGHGLGADDIGAWFDGNASALILDQRAFWVLALLILVLRGAGPISLDRLVFRAAPTAA
ncbi:DoxX family membrane protein [Shimia ponticola]|uniref:DoxX family membrane protein n=1 Tax=Shimia ponticola TaxID=2582893 RepID=UPI0011BD49D1|nr:DoxX family membrane protein [Shimia ponticola]